MKPTPLLALACLALASASAHADEADGAPAADERAAPAPPSLHPETEVCLSCHEDPELTIVLKNGDELSLAVDPAELGRSIHAKLACTDCHADLKGTDEEGHAKKRFGSAREFTVKYSDQCQPCHSDYYKKTLDSVHRAQIEQGNLKAAVCADCHGSHAIREDNPRRDISKTCARCHPEESATYAASVHGKALLDENNPDVPTCTDCHRSHDIADPRTGAWRLSSPDMCGRCHADAERMKKYGLSTDVLRTYLADFHGMTAALQKSEPGANPVVALCSDCHGIHDITRVKDPDSKVVKENLVKTCRKCHPDASTNFPAAWMSHYPPSVSKTPLVYAVSLFYKLFVPFVIGGLVLQILLHLWRVVVNR